MSNSQYARAIDIHNMTTLKRRLNVALTKYPGGPSKKSARYAEPMQIAQLVNARTSMGPSSGTQQAMRIGGWANPSRGGELKFKDNNFTTDPPVGVNTWSAGTLLNGMATGSDASTRIGRKITIKSLLARWSFQLATTSVGGSPVRILIVYDKQANATAPAITDILLVDHFNSPNNLSNRDRFVTISDFVSEGISTGDKFSESGVIYKKLNLETMFNAGSAGTIGDITSGSIYMFVCQDSGITTAVADFQSYVRIRYTDV